MTRTKTVKYALVKVVVDHDEKTDPDEVVLRGELVSDIKGGYIENSTIVDVMTEEDLKDEEES